MTARIVAKIMFCLLVAASVPVLAGDTDPAEMPQFETQEEYINWMYEHAPNVDSFTIKLKPGKEPRPRAGISQKLLDELSVLTGVKLRFWVLGGTDDWQRIRMDHYMTQKDAEAIAEKLATHPDIESAGVDGRLYPMSDARAAEQWSFQSGPGAANIAKAWNVATGSSDVVVAVIDTGIVNHEDIDPSRVLPGYDMITRSEVAADGDGRDNDPSDQGDWVTVFESASAGVLFGCKVTDSSWHGTHVTGIVGATADNDIGIHGVDSAAKLMPMRALGKCGGDVPDAADAITWASGRDVFGAGKSSTKASVINMSVSGRGACPPALKAAIEHAVLDGITVVAAAGNKSVNADFYPANCPGVITVVANDSLGKRATYSNFGGDVTVSAPGDGILSTVNPGTTTPTTGSAYARKSGTSQAAAHVSGVVSLMLSVNPKLKPFEVKAILKQTARPFAVGSATILGACGMGECGAGLLDAMAALWSAGGQAPVSGKFPGHSVLRLPDGSVIGWGSNKYGQLAMDALVTSQTNAAQIPGLPGQVKRVFAGPAQTWAVLENGEAWGWGEDYQAGEAGTDYISCVNDYGMDACLAAPIPGWLENRWPFSNAFSLLGAGFVAPQGSAHVIRRQPVRIPALDGAVSIVPDPFSDGYNLGPISYLAVFEDGSVKTWGRPNNTNGRLWLARDANGDPHYNKLPGLVEGLPPIKKVVVSDYGYVLLATNGEAWIIRYDALPTKLPGLSGVQDVAAVKADAPVYALEPQFLLSDGTLKVLTGRHEADPIETVQGLPPIAQFVGAGIPSYPVIGIDEHRYSANRLVTTQYEPIPSSPPSFPLACNTERVCLLADGQIGGQWSSTGEVHAPSGVGYVQAGDASLSEGNLFLSIASVGELDTGGSPASVMFSVTNVGASTMTNTVLDLAFATNLSLGFLTSGCVIAGESAHCDLGNLPAGDSIEISVSASLLAGSFEPLSLVALASGDDYDFAPSNNVQGVDLQVSQSDGDVPLPGWALVALGASLLGGIRRAR